MTKVIEILSKLNNNELSKEEAIETLKTLNIGETPARMMVNNPDVFLEINSQEIEQNDTFSQTEIKEGDENDSYKDESDDEDLSFIRNLKNNAIATKTKNNNEITRLNNLVDEYFNWKKTNTSMHESSLSNFLSKTKRLYTGK